MTGKTQLAIGLVAFLAPIAIVVRYRDRHPSPAPASCQESVHAFTSGEGDNVTCEPDHAIAVAILGSQVVVTCRCPGLVDAGGPDGGPQ